MKVICIDGVNVGDVFKGLNGISFANNEDCIFNGESYTVIEERVMYGRIGYRLGEKPFINLYLKSRFIPLSDIDETEMVREKLEIQIY